MTHKYLPRNHFPIERRISHNPENIDGEHPKEDQEYEDEEYSRKTRHSLPAYRNLRRRAY